MQSFLRSPKQWNRALKLVEFSQQRRTLHSKSGRGTHLQSELSQAKMGHITCKLVKLGASVPFVLQSLGPC